MTELTPLARKLRDARAAGGSHVKVWNNVAKVAEAELASVAESATVRPVRLPTVEEVADVINRSGYSDMAREVLDLVASLNPAWVPVPADATIPAGTLVRTEQDNYTSEQTIVRDWHGDHRNRKSRFFVPSGTVLTTPDPRIESAARAIYAADQQDGDEQCWGTDTDAIRETYIRLAKAAAEALGVTM